MDEKTFRKILIVLIILFSAIRLLSVFMPLAYLWDEAAYIGMAKGLIKGLPYGWVQESFHEVLFRAPLLTYSIYVFTLLFRNAAIAANFFISLISILSIVLVYFLGKRLLDKKLGLISAAILATNPLHLFFSFKVLTENFFGFLITLSIFFLFLSEKNKKFLLAFTITLVLSIYSRYSGILLVPAALVALFLIKRDWLKEIFTSKYFFLSIIIFALLFIPILTGVRGQLNERGEKIPTGHYLIYWIPILGTVFLFALFGIWKSLKLKEKNILIIVAIVFLLLIGHEFVAIRLRYIIFLLPLLTLIAAYGFMKAEKMKFIKIALITLLLINGLLGFGLVLVSANPALIKLPFNLRDPFGFGELAPERYEGYKIAGLQLKNASSNQDVVISDSCVFVNIYSGRKCYWFANEDYLDSIKDVNNFIKENNVKWVYVIDQDAVKELSNFTLTKVYGNEFATVYEIMKT
jgi:4-amino-4-deoxy-L-arabinose transferase-like glycosyltransferase